MKTQKIGILLANLGTPDEPTPSAVKRYLRQFLTDFRVVDEPRWKWIPLLNWVILPPRSKRVAEHYKEIWTENGSPLLAITREQAQKLGDYLKNQQLDAIIEIGMSYGNPSIPSAVEKLIAQQVDKIIVLPLYPQYSSTTTASVFDAFAQALQQHRHIVPFEFIHSYHCNDDYINALAKSVKERLQNHEFLLFSYHGIPVRYEQEGDYYREHCRQTTLAVVDKLGLTENQWAMTFQSRFGKEEWLQPYTDEFMQNASKNGIRHLAVICPGFSADCLETIEEIEQENKEYFLENGGESYQYIPALNAEPEHIEMMGKLILSKIKG